MDEDEEDDAGGTDDAATADNGDVVYVYGDDFFSTFLDHML